jgi:NAD(P)-dependent dehydrogenase (short-subunit alcohol dehydrogenase family)
LVESGATTLESRFGFSAERRRSRQVDVLVTGGDTELGRAVAESFRDDGHKVTFLGAHRDQLEVNAKEVDALVCDTTDAANLAEVRSLLPHHLDAIVNVPGPRWETGDPRSYSLTELAGAWRSAVDATLLSAVLTVQAVGDHLRSGGSIVCVVPDHPRPGSADAAVKAALSNWVAGQATPFGIRGITVNAVASGRSAQPGYEGLTGAPLPVAAEISRLALFLTTPAARHITGQTLHVSQGARTQFA